MKPKRIQRKRTKGWRMPEGAVSVTRPGKWGNPYHTKPSVDGTRWYVFGPGVPYRKFAYKQSAIRFALDEFRQWFDRYIAIDENRLADYIEPLRGKDLACWCKEGEPCHADVLLELANS